MKDALQAYFDLGSGDLHLEAQGVIVCESASNLVFDPAGVAGPVSIGNLYLEYEFEFRGEALDYTTPVRSSSLMQILTDVTVGARTDGTPVGFVVGPTTAANYPALTIGTLPSGVSSNEDLVGYVFIGTVLVAGGKWATNMAFYLGDNAAVYNWTAGQGMVLSFYNIAGVTYCNVVGDVGSANVTDSGAVAARGVDKGSLILSADATALTPSVMYAFGYWWPLQ